MTFVDDAICVDGHLYPCSSLQLEWPPPSELTLLMARPGPGVVVVPPDYDAIGWGAGYEVAAFERVSMSELTDAERAGMDRVFRGAQYERHGYEPWVAP